MASFCYGCMQQKTKRWECLHHNHSFHCLFHLLTIHLLMSVALVERNSRRQCFPSGNSSANVDIFHHRNQYCFYYIIIFFSAFAPRPRALTSWEVSDDIPRSTLNRFILPKLSLPLFQAPRLFPPVHSLSNDSVITPTRLRTEWQESVTSARHHTSRRKGSYFLQLLCWVIPFRSKGSC